MPEITEQAIGCPYCGKSITVLVVNSLPKQEYIEDVPGVLPADGIARVGRRDRDRECSQAISRLLGHLANRNYEPDQKKGPAKGPTFRVVALT